MSVRSPSFCFVNPSTPNNLVLIVNAEETVKQYIHERRWIDIGIYPDVYSDERLGWRSRETLDFQLSKHGALHIEDRSLLEDEPEYVRNKNAKCTIWP